MACLSRFGLIFFIFFCAIPSFIAAKPSLNFSGYAKELYLHGRSFTDQKEYWQNLNRVRLTMDSSYSIFRGYVEYDQEIRTGTYFQTQDFKSFGFGEKEKSWELTQTISQDSRHFWRHRVYRGWGGIETEKWVVRMGRQRFAWGTGKIWNPTDLLNPYLPFVLERNEREGIDSLYLRQSLGHLSQLEVVSSMNRSWKERSFLGRVRTHFKLTDISLIGGKVPSEEGSWMAGADLARDIADCSFHLEFIFDDPKIKDQFLKYLFGYEYNFLSSHPLFFLREAWVLFEYYHNGLGKSDPSQYNLLSLLQGKEVSLAKDYLGFSFTKELHPLLKLEGTAILNLTDNSYFVAPSLDWNALENLHILAGLHFFDGKDKSEFGRLYSIPYLQAQYFF